MMDDSSLGRIILIFQKVGMKDDKLTILPDSMSNGYNVTFEQNVIGTKANMYIKNSALVPYLDKFFTAIENDTVPYDCVQIDSPTYSTVIISMSNIRNYFPMLIDQINMFQRSWPTETSGSRRIKTRNPANGNGEIVVILQRATFVDDVLRIVPDSYSDDYLVRFEQNYINNTTEKYLNADELIQYLNLFMSVLCADEEPFKHVQIDCPMYPSTIVPIECVDQYKSKFLDMVESIENNWPDEHIIGKTSDPRREYDWDVLAC